MKGCLYAAVLFAGGMLILGAGDGTLPWWWAFVGGGLMAFGWHGLTYLDRLGNETSSGPPDLGPTDYCAGCGCNHLRRWMEFKDGQYRCRVCCNDGPVFVDRNVH